MYVVYAAGKMGYTYVSEDISYLEEILLFLTIHFFSIQFSLDIMNFFFSPKYMQF